MHAKEEISHMDEELARIREKKMHEMQERSRIRGTAGVIFLHGGDFSRALQKYPALVVDFWAEWCGPCRTIGPIIERLSGEFGESVVFAKVNTDDSPEIAGHFGISAIPTVLLFGHGQLIDRIIGAQPEETFRARVKRAFFSGEEDS
jgi:thioredoxin 1